MPGPEADRLRAELIQRFQDAESGYDDDAFDHHARRVFARNFHAVPAYAAYCRARGRDPERVTHWTEIPAVPTAAFKELTLLADDRAAERVFRTSGTTRGRERRGEHHVADLALYRASLRAAFRMFLLPDDIRPRFLSLMPPAPALPDSSLAFMISDVIEAFGGRGSAAFARIAPEPSPRPVRAAFTRGTGSDAPAAGVSGRAVVDHERLEAAVASACAEGEPVLLLGTSAAFIRWLDRLEAAGLDYRLPPGSRLMDTGGYKGAGRRVEPDALRALYQRRLGLEPRACVNEYGMTELLSQWYDDTLRTHHLGQDRPARKRAPGWVRSLAVDPETLEPLPAGESGILRHVDLANLDSVAAVQTEDFGRVDRHGLILEGRAPGASPRGCSIAMDLLLEKAP